VGGTRQPPLDPLLGAAFTHVFGQGQLQQRLVPLLAGSASWC
jgi:4-amino-4-deoxy-L-arabinose transferase-like glycosyltransferase